MSIAFGLFVATQVFAEESGEAPVPTINTDILKGKWKQLRGKIKQTWSKLTDDDIDRIDGNIDEFSGLLQERYGYTKEEAQSKINEVLEKQ